MCGRTRSYRCDICRWQGRLEPLDVGDAAPCPQCGVYLYPLSLAQSWGLAAALIFGTLAVVVVAAKMM